MYFLDSLISTISQPQGQNKRDKMETNIASTTNATHPQSLPSLALVPSSWDAWLELLAFLGSKVRVFLMRRVTCRMLTETLGSTPRYSKQIIIILIFQAVNEVSV